MFIELPTVLIGVHQIKEYSLGDGMLLVTQREYLFVDFINPFILFR